MSTSVNPTEERRTIPLMTRVNARERDFLYELARRFDRSLSKEIGRAIQFYVSHFEEVDRAVQDSNARTRSEQSERAYSRLVDP